MNVSRFLRFASYLVLSGLFFSATASAQSGILRTSTNPFSGQFLVEFSDGTIVIADDSTQRLFVSKPDGAVGEASFVEALASAESDPGIRTVLLQELQSSLRDVEHLATAVESLRTATDDTYWPRVEWCGDVICIEQNATAPNAIKTRDFSPEAYSVDFSTTGAKACNHYLCPELPWPCDMGPCSPNRMPTPSGGFLYSGHGAGWGQDEGGGMIGHQELVAYDKEQFERQRVAACNKKNLEAVETSGIAVATTSLCLAFKTGVGAAGCLGGLPSMPSASTS